MLGSPGWHRAALCLTGQERKIRKPECFKLCQSSDVYEGEWQAESMIIGTGFGGKTGQWQPEHCVWSPGSSFCREHTIAGSRGRRMLEVPCLWLGSASEAEEEGALLSL